jgi:hypothetical protein
MPKAAPLLRPRPHGAGDAARASGTKIEQVEVQIAEMVARVAVSDAASDARAQAAAQARHGRGERG